jgi:hypothetical protein
MVQGRTALTYNRAGGGPSGGGDAYDHGGSDRSGYWPDGTPKSTTSQGGPVDPRYPQLPPGVPVPGKNFAYRPELVAKGYRGGDYVALGPGSPQWTRGADLVLNKQSLTTSQVAGPRRRPR